MEPDSRRAGDRPARRDGLEADLERERDGVFLGRLLETLVEDVSLGTADGERWLRLEKRVPRARGEPGA